MRTYEKILIFLFAATVAFSTFIVLPSSDNDDALRRFRSFFSKQSVRSLPAALRSIQDETSPTSLYYGGISLLAIIMIGVALRMARGGDSKAPRQQPADAKRTVAETGKLPSRGERNERRASEAALQDSEAKARRIYTLEGELSEKDKLLKIQDHELEALRSQVRALTEQQNEMNLQEESVLRQELERKTDLLQVRDSAIKDLEQRFGGRVESLEDQLRAKDELLKSRGRELEELRSELRNLGKQVAGSLSANEHAEELLQAKLSKPNLAIQLNEETENSRSFEDMGALLAEKEELLKMRDNRIEKLEAELKEKRTELARHEIDIRQSIERRDLWKRRLAKFGIPLKD